MRGAPPLPVGSTIGILGGGQLARMLCAAAARLGYRTVVLEPDGRCPAAQLANAVIDAPYTDAAALRRLAEEADVVTYEFENVDHDSALRLSRNVVLAPPAQALAVSQDRAAEKRFFEGVGIPVSPWREIDGAGDLVEALSAFGGGVLKTRRFGYDGKGQLLFHPDARNAWADADAAFADLATRPGGLVLERFVPFACEISIIATRATDGTIVTWPVARNTHRDGILRQSRVPATGVAPAALDMARNMARRLLDGLDYVGTVGLELFVLDDGSLLANE